MCLVGILLQPYLRQAKLLELVTQIAVLLTDTAQIEIVVPDFRCAALDTHDSYFERRDNAHCPEPNQPRRLILGGALDLDGEAENLNKNGYRQDCDIAIAAHESVHNQLSAISGQLS